MGDDQDVDFTAFKLATETLAERAVAAFQELP